VEGGGEAFWQERAEQLQQALRSRLIIEQAKGRLGERIGLSMQEAFELLRYAARSQGMKLQALALSVVDEGETPQAVIDALGKRPEITKGAGRPARVLRTEEHFRGVNEAIADLLLHDAPSEFFCECGNPNCNAVIHMPRADLRLLHTRPGCYAVIPGHQIPDLENVITETADCLIVQPLA
jgi:hypothetical protein